MLVAVSLPLFMMGGAFRTSLAAIALALGGFVLARRANRRAV
jgi:hypothetical protein